MLVFNEGVPRSGKSYDAVKNHILVALKAGRTVVARLNGLKHDKIAEYLGMDLEDIKQRLIHVPTSKVIETFQAEMVMDAEGGSVWAIPAHLQNVLFVIDEVHEFYVAGRQPLKPAIEQFFALHGQNGMDGVIMTQAYKRLHPVIRARIERKNQFQKLTVLGMKGRYRQTFFTTIAPDKYEKVSGVNLKYDPAIFPLYDGYAPGATNVEVYDAGSKSVWAKLWKPIALFALVLCFAIPMIAKMAHGDVTMVKKAPTPAHMSAPAPHPVAASVTAEKSAPVKSAAGAVSQHGTYNTEGMPPEVAYIFEMSQQARPRVSALLTSSWRGTVGIIEWREDQGHVLERMDLDTLRSFGLTVDVKPYGVRIAYEKQVIVATQWPVDMPGTVAQDSRPVYAAAPATPSVSEPSQVRPAGGEKSKYADRGMDSAYVPPEQTKVSAIGTENGG